MPVRIGRPAATLRVPRLRPVPSLSRRIVPLCCVVIGEIARLGMGHASRSPVPLRRSSCASSDAIFRCSRLFGQRKNSQKRSWLER